ncbi:hypothetical protein [Photobacterium lucens]|uniref:hypothetical protein n=1 Tax=Photobacterium lucens TaxID=2562949 RepID=UPI00136905C6|nr:hypothetical protein [Photobacterium lucens]MBP2700852.1 hypothetical protein [Vibrio parahaemolyticus]MZG56034.1 hypothetical protein [Photobacterium lucens]MZG79580.1 hypothetical protein [Photobacterium lucens]
MSYLKIYRGMTLINVMTILSMSVMHQSRKNDQTSGRRREKKKRRYVMWRRSAEVVFGYQPYTNNTLP